MKNIILTVLAIVAIAVSIFFFMSPKESNDTFLQKYTKGYMEVTYLGNKDTYTKVTQISNDEANKLYEESVDIEMQYFNEFFEIKDLTQEETKQLKDLIKEVYKKSKYEVSLAREIDENTYEVDIKISPLNVIKVVEEVLIKKLEEVNETQFKDMNNKWGQSIINILKENISNIGYFEDETVVVKITKNSDNIFGFEQDSLNKIDSKVIKYDYN